MFQWSQGKPDFRHGLPPYSPRFVDSMRFFSSPPSRPAFPLCSSSVLGLKRTRRPFRCCTQSETLVAPGRELLHREVEVDETLIGGKDPGRGGVAAIRHWWWALSKSYRENHLPQQGNAELPDQRPNLFTSSSSEPAITGHDAVPRGPDSLRHLWVPIICVV